KPAILLVTGPMMTSRHGEERLGACTDCRRFWAQYRAGDLSREKIDAIGARLCTTEGTCPVMGTASTMACLAETMGMTLPGTAAIPAVHADRWRAAEASGSRAVGLGDEERRPSTIVTKSAVDNALRVLLAIGGSTNGILHLAAIAGRAGIDMPLAELNGISDDTPVLVDLKPTGPKYMEDLFAAGGLAPILRGLQPLLDLDAMAVTGGSLGDRLASEAETADLGIVKSLEKPLQPQGGLIALFGSLAPGGAILKRSAADSRLFEHEGRAVVFESLDDLAVRIDDPDLDVTPDDILILQNAGPKSGTGMPEAGYLPIPGKLAKAGVKDMIRISDARMSGTAFGTIILHVTPEAAAGGPLGLVRHGDRIRLSVRHHCLDLLVSEEELSARRQAHRPPEPPARGYARLYHDHVLPADAGCDFDFLRASG
ncbi:MAG: dihydroxy-acid dehydratase, partial [Geminicoccaceae bacterium]